MNVINPNFGRIVKNNIDIKNKEYDNGFMVRIAGNNVFLRDITESDIKDYIRWNTIEKEWMLWDAPWEKDDEFNIGIYKDKIYKKIENVKNNDSIRTGFEICIKDEFETHIGWVNSYFIDEKFEYTHEHKLKAIGIDIPELSARRNGFGTEAWILFIKYLKENGINEIYTQTWSGNYPVLGLIKKIGFIECNRNIGYRKIGGNKYDGLTFILGE